MTPPPPRSTLFPYTTLFRSEMKAIVHRDGKEYQMSFEKGVKTKDLEETGEVPADQTGSSIWFKPDPSIFVETTEMNYETIHDRLQESAFLNGGLTIKIGRASCRERVYDVE